MYAGAWELIGEGVNARTIALPVGHVCEGWGCGGPRKPARRNQP